MTTCAGSIEISEPFWSLQQLSVSLIPRSLCEWPAGILILSRIPENQIWTTFPPCFSFSFTQFELVTVVGFSCSFLFPVLVAGVYLLDCTVSFSAAGGCPFPCLNQDANYPICFFVPRLVQFLGSWHTFRKSHGAIRFAQWEKVFRYIQSDQIWPWTDLIQIAYLPLEWKRGRQDE
jgi:hypothetical protein